MHIPNRQLGLTIVELMVALLLSLLLVGGVLQIYIGTKSTYRVTEGLSRLQENTRFSTEMLARDIRMAGYIPCSQPQNKLSLVNSSKWWSALFENSIKGFENGANPFPGETNEVLAGSDSIIILRGGNKVAAVNFYDAANDQIIMQRDLGGADWVEPGSLMIACDSTTARLFQAGAIQSSDPTRISIADGTGTESPGNTTANLGHSFSNDSQLANYFAVAYYITDSSPGSGSEYSLYRRYLNVNSSMQNSAPSEELIENVETMQLLYGLDLNNDGLADKYLKADNSELASNWQDVVTVRVGLLFASEDGLREAAGFDEKPYVVANTVIDVEGTPGVPTHARDKRKRYVSSMTVSVRNI
ncbi:MAG: PilW family protein [Gammaproteobacteria bacterium]|nr:PilW family protein [Gammaproteobacteria bacterium]